MKKKEKKISDEVLHNKLFLSSLTPRLKKEKI